MRWSYRRLTILFILFLLAYMMVDNPLMDSYIVKLKADALEVTSQADPLYLEIVTKKKDYEQEAIDARIDPVWKKMPGLSGRRVDVEASYEKMKTDGFFDEDKLVFEEVPPRVLLKDLPPAPIYRGVPEKPQVAFTINVAWGEEHLSSLLSILKKHHLHATFFLEGRWAKQNPDFVKMIADGNHEIGNHSYSHPDMRTLNREQIIDELAMTNEIIKATTDRNVRWFAPPSGTFNDEVVKIASELGMETIMWTVDTIDWQKPQPAIIVNRVTKQVHNGAIILMHPTEPTVDALETLILKLEGQGYKIVTVGELLDEQWIGDRAETK